VQCKGCSICGHIKHASAETYSSVKRHLQARAHSRKHSSESSIPSGASCRLYQLELRALYRCLPVSCR
jgi:hypothetical protein